MASNPFPCPSAPVLAASHGPLARGITPRALLAGVTLYFCAGPILLAVFLGKASLGVIALATVLVALLTAGLFRRPWHSAEPRVGWRTLLVCCGTVLALLVLSGEGRLFYANVDWQVRQGLLGDMGRNSWPFVYDEDGQALLLRAPLGMYFVPALVWQSAGERAAGFAMLVQNGLLIGGMLAALSPLLTTRRARLIGLAVFVCFSGMDALGSLREPISRWDHIESWADGLQFSSTMTLLFWVPHHAIAGWAGAAAYLLWRRDLAPARLLLTITPLVALWSPLAMVGLLPFAAHVGLSLAVSRKLRWPDFLIPALAVVLVAPTLAYLTADPNGAPTRLFAASWKSWLQIQILEILPFLLPLWSTAWRSGNIPGDRSTGTLLVVTTSLLAIPFLQVGQSVDMMMRGSIPALAVLAFLVVEEIVSPGSAWRKWLFLVLAIGAVTPAFELARSLRNAAAPRVDCTMFEAWDVGPKLYDMPTLSKGTYLARLDRTPSYIAPDRPTTVPAYSGRRCWTGHWHNPIAPRPAVRPSASPHD